MNAIKKSVGEGGKNVRSDVALVQVMLKLVKNPHDQPYLTQSYTGTYAPATKAAIIAFQSDHGLIAPEAAKPVVRPAAGAAANSPGAHGTAAGGTAAVAVATPATTAVAGAAGTAAGQLKGLAASAKDAQANYETKGLIEPGSRTFAELDKALLPDYKDMAIFDGTRTVYLGMTQAQLQASVTQIQNYVDLRPAFKANVIELVKRFHQQHKLVLSVVSEGKSPDDHGTGANNHGSTGWRRTFEQQAELWEPGHVLPGTVVTGAGPGESNHNWGNAVDVGIPNLRWFAADATIRQTSKRDWWFNGVPQLMVNEALKARDKIALDDIGLFPTYVHGGRDVPHYQAFDDSTTNLRASLAAHLQAVSLKQMKWTAGGGYLSDLGLGGKKYALGRAYDIWKSKATITKAQLAEALNAKLQKDSTFKVESFLGLSKPLKKPTVGQPVAASNIAGPPLGKGNTKPQVAQPPKAATSQLSAADITDECIAQMRKLLLADWQEADRRWIDWNPTE